MSEAVMEMRTNPDYQALGTFEEQRGLFMSPYEDVPSGDWSYGAINDLMQVGLWDGRKGRGLPAGVILTRIEMAEMVGQLLSNYIDLRSGDNPFDAVSGMVAQAPSARRPASPSPSPSGLGGPQGPRHIGPMLTSEPGQVVEPDAPAEPVEPAPPVAAEPTIQEKIELSLQQIEELEGLVAKFRNELQDMRREFRRELASGKRERLTNQRNINRLLDENKRFSVTGQERFTYVNEREIYSAEAEVTMKNRIRLQFDSTPVPDERVTLGGSFVAETDLGGRTGHQGIMDGSNTALSLDDLYIDYTNPRLDRHFGLQNLRVGDMRISWSPLTAFGAPWRGATATLQWGDWAISMFGARTNLHTSFYDAAGREFKYVDDTVKGLPYDRYSYGASLSGKFLGEPASMFLISRMITFDDKHSVRICEYINPRTGKCDNYLDVGEWMFNSYDNMGYLANPAFPEDHGLFHAPPEKNSITSVFLRYPMSGLGEKGPLSNTFLGRLFESTYITTEFAHSTYYRQAYRAEKAVLGQKPEDPYRYEPGRNNDPADYRYMPERNLSDQAFLLLFDYNKGPWQMFPLGYVRLGPGFTSTTFLHGIGGLLGSEGEGLDIASVATIGLPVQVQSLELMLGRLIYTAPNRKYKIETMYLQGGEIEPLFIDPALTVVMVPDLAPLSALDWLNNRKGLIDISAFMHSGEYYVNPNLSVSGSYVEARIDLVDPCVDSTIIEIKDIDGTGLVQQFGDGVANCEWMPNYDPTTSKDITSLNLHLKIRNQSYGLKWKTSPRAEYKFSYNIMDLVNNTTSPLELGGDVRSAVRLVDELITRRQFTHTHSVKYKLGETTDVNLSYSRVYDRLPDGANMAGDMGECFHDRAHCIMVEDKYTIRATVTASF